MDGKTFTPPSLGLSPGEVEQRFAQLQGSLVEQWRLIRSMNQLEQTMVVVPSFAPEPDAPGGSPLALEERLLFLLLLLRKPRARIIYCSSQPILPSIIEYYLGLLPGVIPSHARSRLITVAVHDATPRPLALKLLERPRMISRIRELISDPATTHLVPLSPSELERDLALRLGIPMYGAEPRFLEFGSAEVSRRLFAEEGVCTAAGDGVDGVEVRTASAQLRITPLGSVELLSTHDQLPYVGDAPGAHSCRFPADDAYAATLTREAAKVGERLCREGLLGRLEVEFQVARDSSGWHAGASGINLQKGGTTAPFLTLEFLTNGRYDPQAAVFTTAHDQPRCYVSNEHVEAPCYRYINVDDLFDMVVRHGLHFDHTTQTGVVLHMLSALTERGCFGLTAVAESRQEASELFDRAVATLGFESERAAVDPGLP